MICLRKQKGGVMDNTNINNDVLKNLPSVSRRYLKLIDQKLATYQLSSSTYYYIIKLYEFGDLTQDKLVRLTGLNPSNVTRAIQKLIFLDYIKNSKSRRWTWVYIIIRCQRKTDISDNSKYFTSSKR